MQQTFQTNDVTNCPAAAAPLILGRLARSARDRLATGAAEDGPVFRSVGARPEELAAAREALADPRGDAERVLDGVVDRLMKELTW